MAVGKDTDLDGHKWNNLDPTTTTAQRRESVTGVEAQQKNTRSYSQVTSPDIKSKTKTEEVTKDPGVLTLLSNHRPGESKYDILSRITIKLDTKLSEEKVIGKAN